MTAARPTRKPVVIANDLSQWKKYQLLRGHDFFDSGYGRDLFDGDEGLEQMRADWEEHRDGLLAEWLVDHPGRRPYAWWRFDAPARREPIDGSVHPFDTDERKALAKKWHAEYPSQRHDVRMFQLYYGCPALIVGEGSIHYETERDYLERLNLLLPGEAERLNSGVTADNDDAPFE